MLFHILHYSQDILSDEDDGQDSKHDEKMNDEALDKSNIQIQQLDGFDTSMEDSFDEDDEPMNIDTFPNDENVSNFLSCFLSYWIYTKIVCVCLHFIVHWPCLEE